MGIAKVLEKDYLERSDLVQLLKADELEMPLIIAKAAEIRQKYIGNKVYFRGLIEYSNICSKNCYYCGIRAGNSKTSRYQCSDEEVMKAVRYAYNNKFGSVVLQSGERNDKRFVDSIDNLLKKIKEFSNGEIGITLSLGEQTEETYSRWFESGAHRYLLRVEEADQELYKKLHPNDDNHRFKSRIAAIDLLRKTGYQVGTGVMIGLPFQTIENLADDLIFFRDIDVDMVGMGPYVEHEDTPLYKYRNIIPSKHERFLLAIKMIALLRIIMKDINIAATTALQTLDPLGREQALDAGANIMMPNLTPLKYRESYQLYEDKPGLDEEAEETKIKLENRIIKAGYTIGYSEWGDSKHFTNRGA
jgi:biotin synthase